MEIGLGLYRSMLTGENFAFARQLGVTSVVAHLESYITSGSEGGVKLTRGDVDGWGAGVEGYWTEATFRDLIDRLGAHGLKLAAIANFAVWQWSDVLLAGPRRDAHLEKLGEMIRAAGRAGVRCFGYNFSVAGVWGWSRGPFARGGATSVGFDANLIDSDLPIPDGMVWNMRCRAGEPGTTVPPVSADEIWIVSLTF